MTRRPRQLRAARRAASRGRALTACRLATGGPSAPLWGAIAGLGLALALGLPAGPDPGAATERLSYREQQLTFRGTTHTVRVPYGYVLEIMTRGLKAPRMPTFAENGDLFIGSRSGSVYRLEPPYRRPTVVMELPKYPHSVAVRGDEMLIAQTDGLYRARYGREQYTVSAAAVNRLAPLPAGRGHDSRTVRLGPRGRVFLSLGISGNCSDQFLGEGYAFEDRRGGILLLREGPGGPAWEPFASGLRNPVDFDWHPETEVMYATNNGPDHWGYEQPPEYFSRVEHGSFHGMPWFQYDGERIVRDSCIEREPPRPKAAVVPPAVTFPARNAPLGMAFVPEGAMDPTLVGDAVVALHGSWATRPDGDHLGDPATRRPPKLVVVRFEGGEARRVDELVTGFQLENGERWARPAGVAVGPDGAVYFTSDEEMHALFRLRRQQ